jgi:hypothetical protein
MRAHGNDGACTLRMPALCATPLDQTRRSLYGVSELCLGRLRPEGGIQPAQHNLQCPAPVNTYSRKRQIISEHASATNARDETGHYLSEDESSPFSKNGHWPTTVSGTSELNSLTPSLLLRIHWPCKICESVDNDY